MASFESINPLEMRNLWRSEAVLRDPLTGLPSRRRFETALTTLCGQRPRIFASVLLLDLTRFKQVNETLGHDAGDSVLRLAARRLKSVVRSDGVSIGIALYPADGDQCGMLLRAAALALHESKKVGRSTFFFFEADMDRDPPGGALSEEELRQAPALNQLEVFYQPSCIPWMSKLPSMILERAIPR